MWELNKSRVISLGVVALYAIMFFAGFLFEKPVIDTARSFLELLGFSGYCAIGLACIWFGNEIGGFETPYLGLHRACFKIMPGGFYVFIGWVWLLAPLGMGIIGALTG